MNDALLQAHIASKDPELAGILLVKKLSEFQLDNKSSGDLKIWHSILDHILPPPKDYQDAFLETHPDGDVIEKYENSITFLKLFIKGKWSSYKGFVENSKWYTTKNACGKVWNSNFVAFRCRTCGFTPCMSVCADCFYANGHEGHDWNVFLSQGGGACDCGLDTVMLPSGFCSKHKTNKNSKIRAPRDFTIFLEHTIPRLIHRICLLFRCSYQMASNEKRNSQYNPNHPAHRLLGYLGEIVELGGDCRQIVANMMIQTDTVEYCRNVAYIEAELEEKEKLKEYEEVFENVCEEYRRVYKNHYPTMIPEFTSFFDELFLWLVKFDYPMIS